MDRIDPRVRTVVVAVSWAIPLVLLLFGAIAAGIYLVRLALFAEVRAIDIALGAQTTLLVLLLIVGAIGGYYFLLSRWTFGGEFVDESVESGTDAAEQIADTADEVTDD